jgi:hypothetical protein
MSETEYVIYVVRLYHISNSCTYRHLLHKILIHIHEFTTSILSEVTISMKVIAFFS